MGNRDRLLLVGKTLLGCFLFGLGFNLFLAPNELNAGGISGLAMALIHITKIGTVGVITVLANLPLFILAKAKLGKQFVLSSLLGMVAVSVAIDVLAGLPKPKTEPLIGALYGGTICGLGMGFVFSAGGSTGGSDIIVRLLKQKWQNVPIGIINTLFDLCVAAFTGIVFGDLSSALYCGIAIFVAGQVIDAVVYRFDYSRVVLIISSKYDTIAAEVNQTLRRGVTFLHGEGCYTHNETKVILTAVRRQQLAELKQMVTQIDPDAFVIVQEAHQVLGDGFSRYSKNAL